VSWDGGAALGELAYQLVKERAVELGNQKSDGFAVKLRGEDVSLAIREPSISQGASKVSAVPAVRDALLDMQRQAGASGGVLLEGRDIGTVVFPSAEAKFFLTASVDVRARRRFDELLARGGSPELAEVQREVAERDLRDSTRPIAPLKQASDACIIDSSVLSIDQVVERIVKRVREVEAELAARA
jgi:cytidylate kinase